MSEQLWACVDELIDHAGNLNDLFEHRLELLAARRWRVAGRAVPRELIDAERAAAIAVMTTPLLLEKIRSAVSGPIVLMKGMEIACRYPEPSLRAYGDLDLLVPDARAAHDALQAAGFRPVGDPALYVDIHHLQPLMLHPFPLPVEIHSRPKWIEGLEPPPADELLDGAVASRVDVDGISALRPDHQAVTFAGHAWAHEPLRRISELIDVAVTSDGLDRALLASTARRWRMERVWETTIATSDALFGGRVSRRPLPLRLWARNLPEVRSRTVFESHLERWLAGFWALPPRRAVRAAGASTVRAFVPAEGETWREKLTRTRLAFRHASTPRSEHESVLQQRRGER